MPDPVHAFRRRLGGLLAALTLAAIACIGLAVVVARHGRSTVAQLADVELEAARLARQFRAAVDDLHGALLRLGSDPGDDIAATMEVRRLRLNRWLEERLAASRTAEERGVLQKLQAEMRIYFLKLDALAQRPEGLSARLDRSAVLAFDDEAIRLQSLADDFAAVHDTGLRELLGASLGAVRWLRNLVFGCLALLVAASALVGALVYRDVVRPLRLQLVESETLLVQREKLAALGTLAAGVAHEIRNPLTAIKARLYTLRRLATAPDAQDDVHAIAGEIDRLEGIVRNVLGYSRPAEPALADVELGAWLREVAAFIAPGLQANDIELVVDAGVSAHVRADAGQLRQIVLNLVRNAEEALEGRRGCITLAAKCETVSLRGRSTEVAELSVADDGPGIPPEIRSRLFDPFFTTKAAGTGLGLSMVARLVENHSGEIVFQTAPRAGTRFVVRLPLVGNPALAPAV